MVLLHLEEGWVLSHTQWCSGLSWLCAQELILTIFSSLNHKESEHFLLCIFSPAPTSFYHPILAYSKVWRQEIRVHMIPWALPGISQHCRASLSCLGMQGLNSTTSLDPFCFVFVIVVSDLRVLASKKKKKKSLASLLNRPNSGWEITSNQMGPHSSPRVTASFFHTPHTVQVWCDQVPLSSHFNPLIDKQLSFPGFVF